MFKAKVNGDVNIFKGVKQVSENSLIGYKKVNEYFVDNSGFGSSNEPALTKNSFLSNVKQGYFYGITSIGQFQVYIGEYEKINRKTDLKNKGIVKSRLLKKHLRYTEYLNGDIVYRLYDTDIIIIRQGKTILNSGGYKTHTTKKYINMFSSASVYQKDFQWYIRLGDKDINFIDGIEI